MELTPKERTLRARLAAYELHSQGKTNTKAARAAYDARWALRVDPEGVLSPEERDRRATAAKKAHYTRMAFESSKRRRGGAA
jgi:hypothetical protein